MRQDESLPGSLVVSWHTVYLETTDGLDFKTQKFPPHIIYSRYRIDEENPYTQFFLFVLFWMGYAMSVEVASLK